jgi:hypothetical protein
MVLPFKPRKIPWESGCGKLSEQGVLVHEFRSEEGACHSTFKALAALPKAYSETIL